MGSAHSSTVSLWLEETFLGLKRGTQLLSRILFDHDRIQMLRLVLAALTCQFLGISIQVVTAGGTKGSLLLDLQIGITCGRGPELGQLVLLARAERLAHEQVGVVRMVACVKRVECQGLSILS